VAELDRLVAEAPFPFGTDWKRGSMTTTPATERGGGAFIRLRDEAADPSAGDAVACSVSGAAIAALAVRVVEIPRRAGENRPPATGAGGVARLDDFRPLACALSGASTRSREEWCHVFATRLKILAAV